MRAVCGVPLVNDTSSICAAPLALPGCRNRINACTLVGHAMGLEVRAHPGAAEELPYEDMVAAVATDEPLMAAKPPQAAMLA